jgi:hypothetical protein
MNLDQAWKLVENCSRQMGARYGKPVFDEWAIVALTGKRGVLHAYTGPRKDGFRENFLEDAGTLRTGLLARQSNVGDYDFERHGVGTGFEGFMVVGENLFLICNHTAQTMDAIAKDPSWLSAQVPFVELSEKFRNDPLKV